MCIYDDMHACNLIANKMVHAHTNDINQKIVVPTLISTVVCASGLYVTVKYAPVSFSGSSSAKSSTNS